MVSVNLNNRNWKHVFWLFGACLMVFGLPFMLLKIIGINIDLFYLVFLTCGVLFIRFYAKRTSLKLKPALNSGWALGIILAVFIGVALLSYTLSIKANLLHLESNSNFLAVLWRGVIFGIISAAMISAFPFVVVWRALAGINPNNFRKTGVTFIAIIAISLTSLSYSLGISGFNRDRVIHNTRMNLLIGIPTLISGNPIASPIAGAFLYSGESMFIENKSDTTSGIKLAVKNTGGSD